MVSEREHRDQLDAAWENYLAARAEANDLEEKASEARQKARSLRKLHDDMIDQYQLRIT